MSKVRADNISNRANDGAPILTFGAQVPVGVAITGAGDINIGGNISIGGTLTYEDVTNVDSVGIITAQSGIKVGAGQSICLLYTSPSPRDATLSRMPSSA